MVFQTTSFWGRAASGNSSPVRLENSYIFVSPVQAKADGQEAERITVFILDGRGVGVVNKRVELTQVGQVNIREVNEMTDDMGRAIFEANSVVGGKFEVGAKVEGKELPQKVNLVFY
jgi:hypothetical protein